MARHSAQQDLRDTSLKSVQGGLNKLQYLADLRDSEYSPYSHWGLARVHGEEAASRALADEHRRLLAAVLATPVEKLLQDVRKCSEVCGTTPELFVEKLCSRKISSLLPPESNSATERHLSSVLNALSALVKSQADATRRV
jgi:hypothetical protein